MNKKGFKTWLEEKGHAPETVSSRISSAKRVERNLDDLDDLFSAQKKEKVLEQFHYSTADKREKRPNPSDVPIKGDLKDGLASIRRALNLYHEFFETRQNRARIEAGFDAYDSNRTNGAHSEIFGGFGKPHKFWVRSSRERGNRVYPTKPINGFVNTDYGGGFGAPLTAASVLHNAGFIIVSEDDTPVEVPSKPFLALTAQRYRIRRRIFDTLLKRRIYHRFGASQFSGMILICFLGERLPPRSSGVDLRADERSPSRETGFWPACRTTERPRQKQVGQVPSGNRGAARQRVPQKFIAKRYNSSPANLANWQKKRGIKKPNL